jgi:hypothetical protein
MTNQPQHTQGPWYAHTTFISGETDNIAIAQCSYRGEVDLDEAMANAQLIAAAPDMLEALEGVLHHNDGVKEAHKLPNSLIREIVAALAKAKGYPDDGVRGDCK